MFGEIAKKTVELIAREAIKGVIEEWKKKTDEFEARIVRLEEMRKIKYDIPS